MKTDLHYDPMKDNKTFSLTYSKLEEVDLGKFIINRIIELASEKIVEQFIKDHQNEILANLDITALTNLVMAESASGVREAIYKKFPDKIIEKTKTEIYQRGIFGELSRLR